MMRELETGAGEPQDQNQQTPVAVSGGTANR
jgi:hypothetical protein